MARELLEELGATATVGRELQSVTSPAGGGESVQHFFAARLLSMDESLRVGDEHTDATRGGYDRIPLDDLAEYDLKPAVIRDWILANRSKLLADPPPVTVPS